jgi:hypothetical protein
MQLMLERRFDEAVEHFQHALRVEPSLVTAQNCLEKAKECQMRLRSEVTPDEQNEDTKR